MGAMTPALRQAIEQLRPAMVATANLRGEPNLSLKGSFTVLDDDHLIFADLRSPRTLANLKENPQLAAMGFDAATRHGWRIWGQASEILASGELFERLRAQYAAKGPVRHVVKIEVLAGEVF